MIRIESVSDGDDWGDYAQDIKNFESQSRLKAVVELSNLGSRNWDVYGPTTSHSEFDYDASIAFGYNGTYFALLSKGGRYGVIRYDEECTLLFDGVESKDIRMQMLRLLEQQK